MTYDEKINQLIEIELNLTQIIELENRNDKKAIINIFLMFLFQSYRYLVSKIRSFKKF